MPPNPQPKTAIVTGAAQGIGRAIAIQLASDGFAIVISDIASKQDLMDVVAAEIKSKNAESQTLVVPADVSSEADVNKLVAKTKDTFGGLDVVSLSLISTHSTKRIHSIRRWSPMLVSAWRTLFLTVRIKWFTRSRKFLIIRQ